MKTGYLTSDRFPLHTFYIVYKLHGMTNKKYTCKVGYMDDEIVSSLEDQFKRCSSH